MALKSGSLGTLLQGVSQQPDRVRLEGQVTEQVNLISDVTLGLSTRPATNLGPTLPNATSTHKYRDIKFLGQDFIIGYKAGDLKMWSTDGTEQTLNFNAGSVAGYVGDDMRFHVVDDKIVMVNRNVTVQASAATPTLPAYTCIFHALGGQFLKTYGVEVTFSNGVTIGASYTAPDGTADGDAAETTSEYIAEQLRSGLAAHGSLPASTQITRKFDVVSMHHPTLSMQIKVSDGEGGEILRAISDTTKKLTDLPRFAPNGMIVKVVTSDATEDDYWLKFDAKGTGTENGLAGFGNEGLWVEWYDPLAVRLFNRATMPHTIEKNGNDFDVDQGPWLGRSVGDADSAPFASVLDKTIRDIEGFEGRLALLTPTSVVMSRTNEPFDLWRESATVVSATDPIDITSTKKDDLRLDWFVPFDRDIYIMADPGDSQFVIRGGGIEPNTVSMVLTTQFEIASGGTRPVSTGRTILFPYRTGAFSGIKEFYTDSENASQAANGLTETQDRYIEGGIDNMVVSQNFNLALFTTELRTDTVWVYKFLWDGTDLLQSAWSKWRFQDSVLYFFFRDSELYFIGSDANGTVFLHNLDLNRPLGIYGYHEMVDRRAEHTLVANYVDLPYDNARFIQSTGCAQPGTETVPASIVRIDAYTYRHTLDETFAPIGATVISGQTVEWYLEPTEVFARDYQGRLDTSQKVTIQDYVVHVENSGEFKAVGTSPYSPDWEYFSQTFPLDGDPLDTDGLTLTTGPVYIPWGERADWSSIQLTGTDIKPVTIHEVEWIGQILKTKGRRA